MRKNRKGGTRKTKKFKFKMLSAFTILLLIILVLIIISWVLNGVEATTQHKDINGELETVKIKAAGIIDLFWAPMKGFIQKAEIIIFILSIGAFINVLLASKALIGSAQWITSKLKGKELWAILPLMLFFSICGSVEGMSEESLGFYMVVIPLMVAAGFDTFTSLMIVLLGAGVGVMGSTVNPFLITVAINGINESGSTLNSGDGLIWRMISWVILTSITIAFVMIYAKKVKKNSSVSITFSTHKEDKEYFLKSANEVVVMDWRKKVSLIIFIFTLLIMIIYLINWDSILGGERFKNSGEWMNQHIPWITAFIPGFGVGSLVDVAAFFLISSIIVGAINWKGGADFLQTYLTGASDILSVCLIIATASGIGIILQETYIQDLIVGNGLTNAIKCLDKISLLVILFIIFLPLSFLVPSTSGFAAAIFPILGPVLMSMPNSTLIGSGSITAFSFASGIMNLFTPTSGVVMGALAISRVSYDKLLKGIWPLLVMLTAVAIILLVLGSLVGSPIF